LELQAPCLYAWLVYAIVLNRVKENKTYNFIC